ncbi:MAG: hypothetical protein EOP84_07750 [Verrucomicrobiaceae bacterium]|nr:MAG: hypothetical protein EOP84_07750 [Verrucomicrobiaceae bacterium]
MLERLKFFKFAWSQPFMYDVDNGRGYKLLSYNPFTDTCAMRFAQFGYVSGYGYWPREQFETNLKRLGLHK